jgi:thiol:disulfide interchange protein
MRQFLCVVMSLALLSGLASGSSAQDLFGGDDFGFGSLTQKSSKPTMTSTLKADPAQPNIVTLEISFKIPDGSYIYSMNPSFGAATKVNLATLKGLAETSDGYKADHEPKIAYDETFEQNLEKFFDHVTWTKKLQVLPGQTEVSVKGIVNFQMCDESACRVYDQEFEATLTVTPGETMENSVQAVTFDGKIELDPASPVKSLSDLPAEFAVVLKSVDADKFLLSVTAKVKPGYHIFATTQDPAMVGEPTTFGKLTLSGLKAIDGVFQPSEAHHEHKPFEDDPTIVQKIHEGTITWTTWLTKQPGVKVDEVGVAGTVKFQICNEQRCVNSGFNFQAGSLTATATRGNAEEVVVTPMAPEEAAGSSDITTEGEVQGLGKDGLVSFLITAFVAGLLALLTPCVFPMIPVTVSFFLKKAEKKQGNPIVLASIYCLGIMGGFTILGVVMAVFFGATALTALANNAWLNIALSVFLIFFAFNLLGMFEIRVPSWMLNMSAQREGQGGIIGVLFMALTFTLVSFTCTFGFVGLLLVYASRGDLLWPILGMLSFSFAFALPFFFLALFPSYLASLPKSGGWMNNVKVVLGIIEIAFAFKFLSVADLAWNPEPYFFDYGLVMSAWMVLSLVAGFYLLGMFRLPHDMPTQQVSVFKFAIALGFIGFGTYLAQGIFAAKKPTGFVWHQIEAFAPPVFEFETAPAGHGREVAAVPDSLGPYLVHHGLEFALDYEAASAYAKAEGKPMLLDFTGVNCVNCRKMEKTVLVKPQVMELLPKFVRVQLFTDTDAIPGIDDKVKGMKLRKLNIKLQEDWFGDVSLPAYVVVSPDGKILSRLAGYNADPQVFVEFIEKGLARWETKDVAMTTSVESVR